MPPSTPLPAPTGPPRRVLVVDDSGAQRLTLRAALQNWGYAVEEAASGEAALQMCREGQYDMVLSDWMMPGMTGLDLCRAFRTLSLPHYGYFILLTSKSDKDEVALGLDAGADDFLSKPLTLSELRARMQAGERLLAMHRELEEKNHQLGATLAELKALYASLDRDLIEARKLQQTLVRDRSRHFPTASVSLQLRPSGHVGGDLVGYFPLGAGRLAFFSVDVSGHGIASAMLAARLAGLLSTGFAEGNVPFSGEITLTPLPPEEVTERLNRLMLEGMRIEQYVTWVYGIADLASGRVDLVQAGHPHPLLLDASGAVRRIGGGGLPVGLINGASWDRVTLTLAPGDRLLLMTDGVTECRSPAGEELGEEGLIDLMRRNHPLRGEAFLEALEWDLEHFVESGEFSDDVSALLIDWKGSEQT